MSEIKELMARVQHSFAVMSQSKSWRKDEDSQTLKKTLAILSESDKLKGREKITKVEIISQQERIKDLISDHYKLTQSLTAEVETQKAEIEKLRGFVSTLPGIMQGWEVECIEIVDHMTKHGLAEWVEATEENRDEWEDIEGVEVDTKFWRLTALTPASPQGKETKEENDE